MGCLAYNYSCSQVTASFMAAPLTYHIRPRLDRFRILLVSPSWSLLQTFKLIKSAVMKLYALFTLHETGWGTRAGVGDRTSTLSFCKTLLMGSNRRYESSRKGSGRSRSRQLRRFTPKFIRYRATWKEGLVCYSA
jgi:hypothetical protein